MKSRKQLETTMAIWVCFFAACLLYMVTIMLFGGGDAAIKEDPARTLLLVGSLGLLMVVVGIVSTVMRGRKLLDENEKKSADVDDPW